MKIIKIAALLLATILPVAALALEVSQARGININLALESDRYWRTRPSISDLRSLRAVGFNAVRIPIKLPTNLPIGSDQTQRYIDRISEVTENAKRLGFLVLIDLHDRKISKDLSSSGAQSAHEVWARLLTSPNLFNSVDIIEPLNEPFGASDRSTWNDIQSGLVKQIRGALPGIHLALTGAKWGEYESLAELVIPENSGRTLLSFHYYAPMEFTHFKAPWVSQSNSSAPAVWSKDRIKRDFKKIAELRDKNKKSIYLGEFGVFHSQPDNIRAEWTEQVRVEAEKLGIGWFYWSFTDDFGIFDTIRDCWRSEIIHSLGLSLPTGNKACRQ